MAFDWLKKSNKANDKTKQPTRRPSERDLTESYVVNRDLTMGLFHNQYPGLKLAGGLVYAMISLPVYFMGFPSVKSKNKAIEEAGNKIIEGMITEIQQINLCCHREGSIWVWPNFSSEESRLIWEFIVDDSVSDVVQNIKTGSIKAVMTDESLLIRTGRDKTAKARRQRTFTAIEISDNFIESEVKELTSEKMKNPFGLMPVIFANNVETGAIRGNSDLSRVLPLLKQYHDVSLAEYEILAQFRPKMIQKTKDVDAWLKNNGYSNITDVDVNGSDLILNTEDESTEIISVSDIVTSYRESKKQIFQQMVETSGVPEILWGIKTTGNHASADENMETLVMFTKDKQRQKTRSYKKLIEYSLRVTGAATMEDLSGEFDVVWNDVDAVSDKVKAEIFKNFATAAKALNDSAAVTVQQLLQLWEMLYPGVDHGNLEEFTDGLRKAATLKQFRSASYVEALDAGGELDI